MKLTPDRYGEYIRKNTFLHYNHIEIVTASSECSIIKVDLKPESLNLHGKVHGGLISTMADGVAGITARADGDSYVTQSFHLNYLRNTASGTIYAKAEVIKRGKTVAVFHVTITDSEDRLLADGVVDLFKIADAKD